MFQSVPLSVCAIITLFAPAVIPAQAGIQEGRSRVVEGVPAIARLQKGHSRQAGMGLCDWIPAFAGMTDVEGRGQSLSVCIHFGSL